MQSSFQLLDDWFLIDSRVRVRHSTIAAIYFSVGFILVFLEVLFFDQASDMANTAFTTRHVIGFHLFFSEMWFIVLGNALLFVLLGTQGFKLPRSVLSGTGPLWVILGVYTLWFVYGSLRGNSWALQEFREMVFAGLSLPPILYFAPRLSARSAIEKYIVPGTAALLIVSIFGAHNSALMIGTFFASYFLLKLLYKSPWALIGLGFVSLTFVVKFAKPMIVMFAFCVVASFALAGYLNPKSRNWILSRFKIRIILVGAALLFALLASVVAVNAWLDGAIEEIIRFFFLKERGSSGGQIMYADISGGRFPIWAAALESWVQNPILGAGLGAEVEAYSKGWVTKVQFHSYIIQALHNTGLVGFLLITGGWSLWLARSLRKVKMVHDVDEKLVLGAMLTYVFAVLFYGLYGHSFSYPPATQLFWLCVGFLCASQPARYRVRQ